MTSPVLALCLLSCATTEVDGLDLLPPAEQLKRLSLDLRGVLPTADEVAAIQQAPYLYEDFADRYLDDPRFLSRVRELYDQRFLVRTGDDAELASSYASDTVAEALADESLRLVSRIVEQDLPWTEVVLADYTMANPVLADVFELDYPAGSTTWEPAHYADGRQHAGVLSMSSIWYRYPSMGGNANRHRANAMSKMLLCEDYLTRPVVLNRAAVDQLVIDPESAINDNESCQSCHSTLDPLASHFFGFFVTDGEDADDMLFTEYMPEEEEGWRDYSGKSPAYYGVPTANLRELAELVADDSRFVDCAVRTFWEGLTQRDYADVDWTEVSDHRAAFEADGLLVKPLVKSIVLSEAYRADTPADPELAARLPGVKVVSPEQLANAIEQLTGYRWTFDGIDGLETDVLGLPVLAGGTDGDTVTERSYEPSVGLLYVQERLAWSAAWHVVEHDLDTDREGDPILLSYVTVADDPDASARAFDTQIRDLYQKVRLTPLEPTADEPQQLVELYKQVYSVEGSSRSAWAAVLTAILRDPALVTY